jgi:proteasome lid subunit RPN8/RPN11
MPSLKVAKGFIFSEELIRTMLDMVRSSCSHNIEYGTYLCKKRRLIYPDIVCQGTREAISIKGHAEGNFVGRFHTHPHTSFAQSVHDHMGMLEELVQNTHHVECVYGYKDNAIKCVEYKCTPDERRYILKYLPIAKNEDSFKVKFLQLLQKLTVSTNVYTIKELEQAIRARKHV